MITKKSTVKTSTKTTTNSKTADKKTPVKKQTKSEKPKFDVHNPCFKTKMSYVYKWLDYMDETYNDPNDDWLEWDEYMVWAVWLRDEEFYRANNIPLTLLSAHERTMMGIYDPISKKSLDDGDRP
jgi:hypothetical protein